MIDVMDKESATKPEDIEVLVVQYYDQIYHLALSILDDPDLAADAAQDSFVAANGKLHTFRGEASVKTWLFAIAINVCRSAVRKRQARGRLRRAWQGVQLLLQREEPVEALVQRGETRTQLWQAVDALAEKHRLPVILHYVHDMTAAEIAQTLGVREGTIYSRLHYARVRLRQVLESASVESGRMVR